MQAEVSVMPGHQCGHLKKLERENKPKILRGGSLRAGYQAPLHHWTGLLEPGDNEFASFSVTKSVGKLEG